MTTASNNREVGNDGLTGAQRWIANMYLDYVNNYITVAKFTDDHGLDRDLAQKIITSGRLLHQCRYENSKVED